MKEGKKIQTQGKVKKFLNLAFKQSKGDNLLSDKLIRTQITTLPGDRVLMEEHISDDETEHISPESIFSITSATKKLNTCKKPSR